MFYCVQVIAPVSVSERLLMNTEEIGVLFSRTINDTGNQTIRATNNIGKLVHKILRMNQIIRNFTQI